MRKRKDSLLDTLLVSSWWISVILAVVAYVGLDFVVPNLEVTNMFLRVPALAAPSLAPMVAVLLAVAALFSSIRQWSRRQLLDSQSSIEEIRKLGWQDFERFVGEAFRRKGYSVTERGHNGSDGGVDLELWRGSDKILVQCKHWKTWKVGVSPVRELYGVMSAEGASDAIFVASGQYTREAWLFAKENGLTLFEGQNLVELVSSVRNVAPASGTIPAYNTALSILIPLAIIVGAVSLGIPAHDQNRIQLMTNQAITGQAGKTAADTTKKQEVDAGVQHDQQAAQARKLFESGYRAPDGCDNWKSTEKMLECGNDRIRAKRLFLAQHPEMSLISEIDLQ